MSEKRGIYRVGDKAVTKADRCVLATWSGQKVPSKGEIHLHLSQDERLSLEVLKGILGIRE